MQTLLKDGPRTVWLQSSSPARAVARAPGRSAGALQPLRSTAAVLSSQENISSAELWDMGIADCEEACGLVPNGSLVLVPASLKAPERKEERIAELENGVRLDENVATVVGATSAKVNWTLDVPTISGRHARLEAVLDDSPPKWSLFGKKQQQNPVRYYVTDLSSTNGTFLNRGRLRPLMPVEIKPGDIIAFGTLQQAYRVVQAWSDKDFRW